MQTGLLVLLLRTDALHDARGRAGFPSLCGAESEGFRRRRTKTARLVHGQRTK